MELNNILKEVVVFIKNELPPLAENSIEIIENNMILVNSSAKLVTFLLNNGDSYIHSEIHNIKMFISELLNTYSVGIIYNFYLLIKDENTIIFEFITE